MNQETLASKEQDYGDKPTAVRSTDHYTKEYVMGFVDKWDELIDWEARRQSEGDFFIQKLKERGVQKVLDVATGTGFHSVQLIKAGFDVTSVDGSPEMLAKAFNNAKRQDMVLRTIHSDWRWLNRDVHDKYDAVVCLGNSFTHIFKERERRKALAEFYTALRHDGCLILDHRNYDALLDKDHDFKHTYYYCGEDVQAEPEYWDDGLARFQYRFSDGSTYHLNMFPLRRDYVRRLMQEVGFQNIDTFGDFKETKKGQEPDFYIHVAEKRFIEDAE